MAVIGVAQLQVEPTFKDFQKKVGAEVDETSNKTASKGKEGGSRWGKAFKVGAVAVVGAAAGAIGVALTKGLGRLTSIENAQAKLRGLGHSAESVATIMSNASAAVKGTSFGLGEAASTAANAVAAGVKPGKDLERTLKLISDASTIAGTDMGSMGAIFNKVAASDMAQMDVINQLHDAGVPALQLVAKELGVTSAEASKMASKGEVDFATFQKAMESGMSGAALESGNTLEGAMKNAQAAVGRFGANILEEVYPKITEFFQGFIDWMGPVEEKAKDWGKAIGDAFLWVGDAVMATWDLLVKRDFTAKFREAFGVEEDHGMVLFLIDVRDRIEEVVNWIKNDAIDAFKRWSPAIAGVAAALGALAVSMKIMALVKAYTAWLGGVTLATKLWAIAQGVLNKVMKANPIILIVSLVAGLVAAFITAYQTNEQFRTAIQNAWKAIVDAIGGAWNWIRDNVFNPIHNWIHQQLLPAMQALWTGIQDVWNGIVSAITTAWEWIRDTIFNPIVDFVRTYLVPVFEWYLGIMQTVWGAIFTVIKFAWDVISNVFLLIVDIVKFVLAKVFTWLLDSVIKPVWDGIVNAITTAWNWIRDHIFTPIRDFIHNVLVPVFEVLRNTIEGVWNRIKDAIYSAWVWIRDNIFNPIAEFLRNTLGVAFTWLLDNAITPVWDGIKSGAETMWDFVKGIFEKLIKFFKEDIPNGIKKGVDLIKKAVKKIAGVFAEPINWVIENVWTNGIKKIFDDVAKAVGSEARLPEVKKIEIGAYAKGGKVKEDWYLAGEQGPELIHKGSASHRVYTASETRAALSGDESGGNPVRQGMGRLLSNLLQPAMHGMKVAMSPFGNLGNLVTGTISSVRDGLVSWVSGDEVPLYDNGGRLPTGLNMLMNKTGTPEAVLTRQQWNDISRLAAQNSDAAKVPGTMTVRIGEKEFTGYVEDIGDKRLRAHVSGANRTTRQHQGV